MNLANLKPGDLVITTSYRALAGESEYRRVRKVDKVLAKHIVVDGTKYHRDQGREVGKGFHLGHIEPATKALIKEVRAENERRRLENDVRAALKRFNFTKAKVPTLEALLKLVIAEIESDK